VSLKDKLEIGLKPDAPYSPDNLPDFQRDDETCRVAGQPGDSPELRRARAECAAPVEKRRRRTRRPATGHRRMKGRR